ncbi:hypothetical protein Poli38472_003568 [Pythium oligandrum]|uniref:RRM domain-containing protein n=1 Tax=Pythium oligandrum TaxID=41045 RepID=A0A8K1FPN5_PYTOL|nr:hypothetical protein Poli38472_003568 [Pythium oligandrum]|eukprot:TMW65803.1 hypothetical protein Poli38472_003568 [Pythium oligandrum]
MARSKKRSAATEPAAEAATAAPVTITTGASLADVFAQSAAFFGKKASYASAEDVQPKPTEKQTDAPAEPVSNKKQKKNPVDAPVAAKQTPAASDAQPKKKKDKKKKKSKQPESGDKTDTESSAAKSEETSEEAAAAESALTPANDPEKSDRTVFVGNVSLDASSKDVKQFFSSCGKVEAVRLRFLPVAGTAVNEHGNQKLMMKVCANKKIFTDKRDFCHAYVTFASKESIDAALKLNRSIFMDKAIRVDHESPKVDPQRSVFVGNLSFRVTDEAIWAFFDKQLKSDEEPAPVENVRVIRDRDTGEGKGFGYVLLKSKALAAKALSLQGKKLEQRELRVQVCGKRFKNTKGSGSKSERTRASPGAASRIAMKRKAHGDPRAEVKERKSFEGAKSKPTKPKGKVVGGKRRRENDVPATKPKKPKHAARKARQAAEAAKAKSS